MAEATSVIFWVAILVMSVVIHEVSHGIAALLQGDKTAKYAGRLTLNPLPHIDPFGSIILPFLLSLIPGGIIIGWAKPVPYNPYNLRNQKWGPAIVGAAGPLSNLAVAFIFSMLIRLAASGILPIESMQSVSAFLSICVAIIKINILLAVFNLVPIPPLDGSKVLFAFLPYQYYSFQHTLEQWGFVLLLIFIFFLSPIIFMITNLVFQLMTGVPLL